MNGPPSRSRAAPTSLAFLALSIALAITTTSRADLVFDQPKANLGRVVSAGVIDHEFHFRASGTQPTEVLEIRPSCGCLRSVVAKRLYLPGEEGTIPLAIHATSQSPGPRRYELTLRVRDPAERTVVLIAEVDLIREIDVEPSAVYVIAGETLSNPITIAIHDRRSRPLRIVSVAAAPERLQAESFNHSGDPATISRIRMSLVGATPPGRMEGIIRATTDDPTYSLIEIPVTIVRRQRVRVAPEELRLRAGAEGMATGQLIVSDAKGDPIRIETIVATPGIIECQWSREAQPRQRVRLTAPQGVERWSGEIVIRLAEPLTCELVVPVRWEP